MTETETPTRLFSAETESAELSTYRPLNKVALLACIAAVASFSALFHSLLWVVPAVAVVLAVSALVSLRRLDYKQTGYGLAAGSLVVAVFVGFYAPARVVSQQNARYEQAQTFVMQWVQLVQTGRLFEAHELRLVPIQRYQGPKSLEEHYAQMKKNSEEMHATPTADEIQQMMQMTDDPYNHYQSFLLDPVVTQLRAAKDQAQLRCTANVSQRINNGGLEVVQRFELAYLQDGQPAVYAFQINSRRDVEEDHRGAWTLDMLTPAE